MNFIISNYYLFIIIAVVLLLGLFGYIMDRKKYEKYREEIINEERIANALEAAPGFSADPNMQVPMAQDIPQMQQVQPGQQIQQDNTQNTL